MDEQKIIEKTREFVESKLTGKNTGHDWWHVYRVWVNAKRISQKEKVDLFIVELAALLHDIADWKFHDGDESRGPQIAREWLENLAVEQETISHVCKIIKDISFKGVGVKTHMHSKEGEVVQDADRLDALGAIGIARTFAYGGSKETEIFNPNIKPTKHKSFEEYKKNQSHTINHFHEKLLLLKDLMNTEMGKKLALERHTYMQDYLQRFLHEWEGRS